MKEQGFLGLARAWLYAALLASALLAICCAGASALSLNGASDEPLTLDSDAHWWNAAEPVTSGNYQFTASWDAVDAEGIVYLQITRRRLSDNRVERIRFDSEPIQYLRNYEDGHNWVALGLSPSDGRIHISFSNHAISRYWYDHYGYSNERCMTEATFRCTFTWEDHAANREAEREWTYPVFFNDREGNLFLSGRRIAAENGDQYLFRYNNNATWTDLGVIISGTRGEAYDADGEGRGIESTTLRNPYMFGWLFDKNNHLHVMWTYRERSRYDPTQSQHDVYYAYSDDLGRTWKDQDSAETAIATSSSDPIKVTDVETMAASYPPGYVPATSQNNLTLDSNNQAHVVIAVPQTLRFEELTRLYCQTHVWRTEDSRGVVQWYAGLAQPTSECTNILSLGIEMFDQADTMYFVYTRNEFGWEPYNSASGSLPFPNLSPWDVIAQEGAMHIVPISSITSVLSLGEAGATIGTGSTANRNIEIRIRNTTDSTSGIFNFITAADGDWSANELGETVAFTAENDGAWHTYTISMERVTSWTGTLRALELYPANRATRGAIDIDYIRIQDDRRTVAKAWEFTYGNRLYTSEATAVGNWSTWTSGVLLERASITLENSPIAIDDQRYADSKLVDFTTTEQGAVGTELLVQHELDITGDDLIKDWGFSVNDMLWTAVNNISGYEWASDSGTGTLSGTIEGSDSILKSGTNLKVATGTANRYIHIRMKNNSASTSAKVYFITDASTTFTEARSKAFTTTARSGYTWYVVNMRGVSGWENNTLSQLRLDPSNDATRTGTFNIDRIYIDNSER